MAVNCEGPACIMPALYHCAKCKRKNLHIGRYCSSTCQIACFDRHKIFHRIVSDDMEASIAWTIALALHDAEKRSTQSLPQPNADNQLMIHLLGSRNFPELHGPLEQFSTLFTILRNSLYPSLQSLYVVISGLEMSPEPPQNTANVFISSFQSRAEDIIRDVDFTHGIAVILQPGLEPHLSSWETAFQTLLVKNAFTITSGYSYRGSRLTSDAVFDERILETYFLANIIVPSTSNPAGYGPTVRKNGFYLAFRGKKNAEDGQDTDIAAISRERLVRENQISFLRDLQYITATYEGNMVYSERCRQILLAIEEGRCPFPATATISDIDNLVMRSHI